MIRALLPLFVGELKGLAQAALAVALTGGVLLGLFEGPETTVLFSMSVAIIFGAAAGGFRRRTGVLEFLLTRYISRNGYIVSRALAGLVPMFLTASIVALGLVVPLSGGFWSLFVESGFTSAPLLPLAEGIGWLVFSLGGAIWAFCGTFWLVSRTREPGEMFLALLGSVALSLGLPVLFIVVAEALAFIDVLNSDSLYSPQSGLWLLFSTFCPFAGAYMVRLAAVQFGRTDL